MASLGQPDPAAQTDFSTIPLDFESQATPQHSGHHRHRAGSSAIAQAPGRLGGALQSGNLSSVQQLAARFSAVLTDEGTLAQTQPLSTGLAASA